MVLHRSYIRTIGVARILFVVIVGITRVITTVIEYPSARDSSCVIRVKFRIHAVEMFAIRIGHFASRLELNGTRPLAGAATCLQIGIICCIRQQVGNRIRIGGNRTSELALGDIGFDVLGVIQRLGGYYQVPFGLATRLGP